MIAVHRIGLAFAVLLAVSSLAPVASAQEAPTDAARKSVDVSFYGHVFTFGYDFPMPANTQFPKGEDNLGLGGGQACTPNGHADGPDPIDPAGNCDTSPATKLVLFSTAGPVDIGSRDEFFGGDQYVQLHNERGSTKDIVLDTSKKASASLYMSLDTHVWFVGQLAGEQAFPPSTSYCGHPAPPDTTCLYPYWGWDPMAHWPDWVVRARLYYAVFGDYGSGATEQIPIREAVESGKATLVGEGQVGPAAMQNGLPGAPNVHRFDIDLGTPKVGSIPKEANFFLLYDWYSESGGNKYAILNWRIWTGEFFPPSFTLPTKNPFDVELVAPVFLHNKLVILGVLNTPWGSYDVKPESTKLVIQDSSGKEIEPKSLDAVSAYKFAHGAHYKPVNVSYIWDYSKDRLAPGTYTATISGANQQATAFGSCTATFEVQPGGRPGKVDFGRCGQTSDQTDQVAAQNGAGSAPTSRERDLIAKSLPYGLGTEYLAVTAGVAPAPAPASAALAAPLAAAVVALGLAFRRRWA